MASQENISKAALKLHISQPAFSTRIRDLQCDVGFDLLERTAKSVGLTDAGLLFRPLRFAKSSHPLNKLRDDCPYLIGAVLLQQLSALDGNLDLVEPSADDLTDAAPGECARLAVDEQFRYIALGQPTAGLPDDPDYFGGLVVNRQAAGP